MNWLFKHLDFDDSDPIGRAYRRYLHRVIVIGLVAIVLVVVAYLVGVPHLQITYTYWGPRPADGVVKAHQKTAANYFGLFGWKQVRSGQYGHVGCPFVLFIPLKDCFQN